ncbi:MAG: hypothetical protein KGL35_26915 [Bradyrhizobium sp.]|nr:hypothetical protein [Bradyrhizobium sp.]
MILTELTEVVTCDFCNARELAENRYRYCTYRHERGTGHRCHRFHCVQAAKKAEREVEAKAIEL